MSQARGQNDWKGGTRELSEVREMFCILFGVVVAQAYPTRKTLQTVLKICALYYYSYKIKV